MRAAATFHTPQQHKKQKGHGDRPWPLGKLLKLKLVNADSPGLGTQNDTPYAGVHLGGLGLGG
jgi:hypothetical protein